MLQLEYRQTHAWNTGRLTQLEPLCRDGDCRLLPGSKQSCNHLVAQAEESRHAYQDALTQYTQAERRYLKMMQGAHVESPTAGQVEWYRQRLLGLKMRVDHSKALCLERQRALNSLNEVKQTQRRPESSPAARGPREVPEWAQVGDDVRLARLDTLRKEAAACDSELAQLTAGLGGGSGAFASAYTERLKDLAQHIVALGAQYDQIDFELKASSLAHEESYQPEPPHEQEWV